MSPHTKCSKRYARHPTDTLSLTKLYYQVAEEGSFPSPKREKQMVWTVPQETTRFGHLVVVVVVVVFWTGLVRLDCYTHKIILLDYHLSSLSFLLFCLKYKSLHIFIIYIILCLHTACFHHHHGRSKNALYGQLCLSGRFTSWSK